MTDEEALTCLFTVAHEACDDPIVTLRGTRLPDEDNYEYVERMYEQIRKSIGRLAKQDLSDLFNNEALGYPTPKVPTTL